MAKKAIALLLVLAAHSGFALETDLRLYRPFSDNRNQAPVNIKRTLQGVCWEQSHADVRGDAWRCMVGGHVYDPCFVKIFGEQTKALCPESPWNGDAVEILVKKQLKADAHQDLDMSTHYPWAIELANGTQCQVIADSKQVYDNLLVRYHCNDASFLVGRLQRCKGLWQVLQKQEDRINTANITRAWF